MSGIFIGQLSSYSVIPPPWRCSSSIIIIIIMVHWPIIIYLISPLASFRFFALSTQHRQDAPFYKTESTRQLWVYVDFSRTSTNTTTTRRGGGRVGQPIIHGETRYTSEAVTVRDYSMTPLRLHNNERQYYYTTTLNHERECPSGWMTSSGQFFLH